MLSGLVETLIKKDYLETPALISAFQEITRSEFVSEEFVSAAEVDMCLPIGCGQTITQPSIVAIMLELLAAQPNQHVLDIGSGSGWTSALLGHVVGVGGKVLAIERLPEIHALGKRNIDKFGLIEAGIVECILGDGNIGYEAFSPYDRILVAPSVEEIPLALEKQLKVGGKMVFPMHNHICYLEKTSEDEYYREEFAGFAYVPLIQKSL